jgi:hypothetical protein
MLSGRQEDMTMKEFRCTRNAPYANPECLGHAALRCRQGYYIQAENEHEALREMVKQFPSEQDNMHGFTAEFWKEF